MLARKNIFNQILKSIFLENIIYGIRPIGEAISESKIPEKVLIQKGLTGENFSVLFREIREKNIPYQVVPVEKLNKITRSNHQGVIAYTSPVAYWKVEDVITNAWDSGEVPLLLILDGVTDVRNFGGIARAAECAGVHAIVIPQKNSAAINATSLKTSAGALNRIPVCRETNLLEAITFIKECGLKIIAATGGNKQTIYEANFRDPAAIIMGSEDKGISKACLKLSDQEVTIPMEGKTGSLNVSVATGVVLFEIMRQRRVGEC